MCKALAHEMAGQTEQAVEVYLALTESLSGPPDAQLRVLVARSLARVGRREEAAEWLNGLGSDVRRTPELDRQIREVERMIHRPR